MLNLKEESSQFWNVFLYESSEWYCSSVLGCLNLCNDLTAPEIAKVCTKNMFLNKRKIVKSQSRRTLSFFLIRMDQEKKISSPLLILASWLEYSNYIMFKTDMFFVTHFRRMIRTDSDCRGGYITTQWYVVSITLYQRLILLSEKDRKNIIILVGLIKIIIVEWKVQNVQRQTQCLYGIKTVCGMIGNWHFIKWL